MDSDIALPAVPNRSGSPADLAVRCSADYPDTDAFALVGQNWSLSQNEWRLWDGKGLHLTQSGNVLHIRSEEDPEAAEQLQWVLGAGFCAMLLRHGSVPWHAAALAFGDSAILIMGDSGKGKSTTAMALIAVGARLLADDLVVPVIKGDDIVIPPVFLNLRLTRQTTNYFDVQGVAGADGKISVSVPQAPDDRAIPLRAIYVLGDRVDEIGAPVRLPKTRAWGELLKNLFARAVVPAFARSAHAGAVARRMVDRIPVFEVHAPEGLDRMIGMAETIRAAVES